MEISIRPQMLSTVNYSLQQNRLSVIRAVTIDNPGEEISGATLLIKSSPAVFEDITLPLDLIPGGREYEINDIRVVLDAAFLAGLTEKITSNVTFSITRAEETISSVF